MKKILLLLTLMMFTGATFATDVVGDWYGQLDIQGIKLRISFHVSKDADQYTSTMDSPDQGVMGIATTKTSFEGKTLIISMQNLGAEYVGVVDEGTNYKELLRYNNLHVWSLCSN